MLVAAGLGASCNGSGRAVSDPPANGGFSGTKAALYEYACALPKVRVGVGPLASHRQQPHRYDMRAAYPVVMIGTIKPHGPAQWRAAKDGCAVAIVKAFADAHSSKTAAVCAHMVPFIPPDLPECPRQ